VPGLGQSVPQLLDRLHVPAGPQGGQYPLAGLGQGGRGRVQVLVIVGGQDLDRVGQRGAEVGWVVGPDAATDAEAGVGDFSADHLDLQQDRAGPVLIAPPVLDADRADDPGPGGRPGAADAFGAAAVTSLVPVGHHQQRTARLLADALDGLEDGAHVVQVRSTRPGRRQVQRVQDNQGGWMGG
jgi:hypothetical protein